MPDLERTVSSESLDATGLDARALALAAERIALGVALTGAAGRIVYTNAWLCEVLGLTAAELSGLDLGQFRAGPSLGVRMEIRRTTLAGETWHGEVGLSTGSGKARPVLESVYPLLDGAGRVERVLHFFHDISVLARSGRLGRLAFHDPLTNLPNRGLLTDRLQGNITAAQRSRGGFAVLYVDIEHLKRVNDTLGSSAGDELLCEIVVRMQRTLRASDTIARLAGDEFGLLLQGAATAELASGVADKLLRASTGWYEHGERNEAVTFSAGMALYPRDGATPEALMLSAEAAMYSAKAARRASCPAAAAIIGTRYSIGARRDRG